MEQAKQPSLALRLIAADYQKSHAYQIANAVKKGTLSLTVALRVHDKIGLKLGPIADATDAKIRDLKRFAGIGEAA